jgi:hypothetical protein
VDKKPVVLKMVDVDAVYFTIHWSRLRKSDKYEIVRSVPSEAGIYELYYQDDNGSLHLFHVAKSWFGGLRNEIRLRTDPELENDPGRRATLDAHDCWYRWSLISSSEDMEDILYFFANTYLPSKTGAKASGRYARVFVKEVDADKIVTI